MRGAVTLATIVLAAAPLAGGGEVRVQLLYALGATFPPPAGGGAPVTILSREGVTQGDPLSMVLYKIILCPPCGRVNIGGPRALIPFLRGRCGVRRFGAMKRTAYKAVDEEGAGPGIIP